MFCRMAKKSNAKSFARPAHIAHESYQTGCQADVDQASGEVATPCLPSRLSRIRAPSPALTSTIIPLTGLKHRNLLLYWQVLLYSIYLKRVICSLREETFKVLKINELITLMAQPAAITVIDLTSNIDRLRYRLSAAKETVILIPMIRLLEKHGPVLLPEARNVVLNTHMHDITALIQPVSPGGARWTVEAAIGS
jgi:hypothetical protein